MSAARLDDTFANEPPSPTIFSGLLLVALDDLGVANLRRVGILPGLAQRAALAQEVPALVERDLDRLRAGCARSR